PYLTGPRQVTLLPLRIGWVVAESLVLDQHPEHVDAQTIDPAVEPEAHDVVHGGPHRGMAPIQLGLPRVVLPQVVLSGLPVKRPGGATKIALPIVGRPPVRRRVAPDIPLALAARSTGARLDEPGMFIRGVIRDKVENDLQVPLMGSFKQPVKRCQVSE